MRAIGALLRQFGPAGGGAAINTPTLNTPTLSVADNGDGTGAVATISGSTAGTTNTVYVADWPGDSFASAGSRTGDGTVALDLETGPKWAYVVSASADHTTVSSVVQFRVTDGSTAVFDRCLTAVRDTIVGLALEGIAAAEVKIQKFPWNAQRAEEGIFVCPPTAETDRPATNLRNELGYPVHVVIVRKANRDLDSNMAKHLLERERIRRAFDHKPLAGVSEVVYCRVEPGVVYDWTLFGLMYDVQTLIVRCIAREPLTVA